MKDIEDNTRKIKERFHFLKNKVNFETLVDDDIFLYVNFPFCSNLCDFCIYKIQIYDKEECNKFLESYNKEIEIYSKLIKNKKFKNVHIGGGTPNLISPELLIGPLGKLVDFDNINRFVVEVFPRHDLSEYLEILRKYNVTKIQMGVQTLNKDILAQEGRKVTKDLILSCLDILNKSGYIWSVDLVYGFKCEEKFNRDYVIELNETLKFNPYGIHPYPMISEENNNHYDIKKKDSLNRHKKVIDKVKIVYAVLKKAGYDLVKDEWCVHENINHAKKTFCYDAKTGFYSNYIGIGPKASTFTRFFEYQNLKDIVKYGFYLDKGILPIDEFEDFVESDFYPISLIDKEIEYSSKIDINKFIKTANLSKNEVKKISALIRYFIHKRLKFKLEKGMLTIPNTHYSVGLKLIDEFWN